MSSESILWLSVQVAIFSLFGLAAFLLLRRRGPSVAAACAATVLLLTLPLLLVSFSPWPRWQLAAKTASPRASISAEPVQPKLPDTDDLADAVIVEAVESPPQDALLAQWWNSAIEALRTPPQPVDAAVEPPPPSWRTWLPWIVVVGVMFGFVRLIVGILAVRRYRQSSTPIDDAELTGLVRQIAGQLAVRTNGRLTRVSMPCQREESSRADAPFEQHLHQQQNPASLSISAERDDYFALEIRETPRLRSAATIGWRRPVLLLPADWRTWTETERRVVIAHEMAHIARRDYLLVLIARFVTAIYFYQPLVLWLARHLRVQQELAADAIAANLTGSRQAYLTTLAQMALRADDNPMPWPARAFLPGAGLLVKRITWLKRNKTQEAETMNRRSRWILVGTMAAIALLVAGIRGPNEPMSAATAAEPSSEQAPKAISQGVDWLQRRSQTASKDENANQLAQAGVNQPPAPTENYTLEISRLRTTEYIPADATAVIVASPSALAESPSVAKLFQAISETNFEKQFGIAPAQIEDVELIQLHKGFDRVVLRSVKPFDWKPLASRLGPDAEVRKSENGKQYFVGKTGIQPGMGNCYFLPDNRTIVIATEPEIKKILAGEKLEKNPGIEASALEVQVKTEFLRQWTGAWNPQREAENMVLASVMPLFEQTDVVTLSAIVAPNTASPTAKGSNEKIMLAVSLSCKSEAATKQVTETLSAVRVLAKNYIASTAKLLTLMQAAADKGQISRNEVAVGQAMLKIATKLLEDAKIDTSTNPNFANVVTEAELPKDLIAKLVLPTIVASREAAARNQGMGNMKELALALHNYADAKKRFPPPVIVRSESKTKLSWRVAILPFIDQADLYDQYHFDEPWDSESNLKLIDKMPAVFRDPHAPINSTSSSYYMVTGKGMFGDSETGRKLREITDGLSKTIMLVEAKRDIPWTKPDDVEIDPDPAKPLPKFGGFFDGSFNVAFADGSVRAISDKVDPEALHSFFTVAGAEAHVSEDVFDPSKPAEQKKADGAAMQPADNAAALKQSMNNTKQILLALHNYLSARKKFPPAASRDANGKPLLSWRVALLPFIEGGRDLYQQFHLDEPWNSEHNRTLIGKMPALFRDPTDDPKSTNASYFMVIGKGTFGDAEKGRRAKDITDGFARTIAIVESKRDIPWTKPEDIEIDPDPTKPLPKFGGHLQPEGRFIAGYADGHVQPVEATADPQSLRKFFTVAGGEIVPDEPQLIERKPPADGKESGDVGADPKVGAAAARRKENINNMKWIGLALHNYASARGYFPPPVLLGSDGKTKCSWRVLILPYIEGYTIKTEYRFYEPWDSENNLKVLAEMPAAFRSPFDAADSTNTSYFMVTGKGTFGDNEEGRVAQGEREIVREVTDGMPNTLMLVEANRSIPWTKPEDIEIAPDRPLPKLGGFLPNGLFNASFADGHVRTLSTSLDEKIFRALVSINGGELVDMNSLVPQAMRVNQGQPEAAKTDKAAGE